MILIESIAMGLLFGFFFYEWVGLSVIIGEHMRNADEITKFIRYISPKTKIKWGGVICSVMPEEIEKTYKPDRVVQGKVGWLGAMKWELLGKKINLKQQPYYQMLMTSEGCPFDCGFCYKNTVGKEIYLRTSEDVCQEMDYLNKYCGTTVFTFGDDNFFINKRRATDIFQYCKTKGYYIEECIGHINSIDDDIIKAMEGTVSKLIFSIESASPRMLKLIGKGVNLDTIPEKLSMMRKQGIICNTSIMIGLPDETDNDLWITYRYMQNLKKIHPGMRGNCYLWFPLPKTRLANLVEKGRRIKHGIKDYEYANFWVDGKNDSAALVFRPHLEEPRYEYLLKWGEDFNKTFSVDKPGKYYILDQVLNGMNPKLGKARC